MLETLVSSRIRRTLFEHLLTHPDERFYLRGLAKELALSISPLRRELLRLERLGMLTAYDEANIRFYVVNQASTPFLQLKQAASSLDIAEAAAVLNPILTAAEEPDPAPDAADEAEAPVAPLAQPAAPVASTPSTRVEPPARVVLPQPQPSMWKAVAGGVSLVASLALVFGIVIQFAVPTPRTRRVVLSPATVGQGPVSFSSPMAVPETATAASVRSGAPRTGESASGEMRSSRWRLQPGTIGGGWSQ
jgi:hypothetical protein